jgi:hypothetical protein
MDELLKGKAQKFSPENFHFLSALTASAPLGNRRWALSGEVRIEDDESCVS